MKTTTQTAAEFVASANLIGERYVMSTKHINRAPVQTNGASATNTYFAANAPQNVMAANQIPDFSALTHHLNSAGTPVRPLDFLCGKLIIHPQESGIVFGQTISGQKIGLKAEEEGNVLLIGSPGSGKSRCVIMPALRSWENPFIAVDIKGELEAVYRSAEKNNRQIIVLNPNDPNSWSVDPFEWLEEDGEDELVSNVTEFASILIPNEKPNENNTNSQFWIESERAVVAASLLFYFKAGLDFPESICRILDLPIKELCEEIGKDNDPHIRHLICGITDMKAETFSGIERGLRNQLTRLSTQTKLLHFFRGRKKCDHVFSWKDIDQSAVFIRIPEEKVEAWSAGVLLLLTTMFRYLRRRPEANSVAGKKLAPCLVIMDEFARFGCLPMITSVLATLRSKSVNILIAIQSLAQLDSEYGPRERAAILDCCTYRIILRVADPENQQLIARMIGGEPKLSPSASASFDINDTPNGFQLSYSAQNDFRIQPSDLASLNKVVIATPYGTYSIHKITDRSTAEIPDAGTIIPTADNLPRTIKEISADAQSGIQAYLSSAQKSIGAPLTWPDTINRCGTAFINAFPELMDMSPEHLDAEMLEITSDPRIRQRIRRMEPSADPTLNSGPASSFNP